MLNALRSVRAQPTPTLFSATLRNHIGRNASGVRFMQQAVPGDKDSMDQAQKPTSKMADTMSSFGEGYATRSDEEGFGGTYGANQYLNKEDEQNIVDGSNNTINDASQGSQVKETEKARNQKTVE